MILHMILHIILHLCTFAHLKHQLFKYATIYKYFF